MAVYALSGLLLIFRNTDFLKSEIQHERTVEPNLKQAALRKALDLKLLDIKEENDSMLYFDKGEYNKLTGLAKYSTKELPYVAGKMVKLHKAKSGEPLYFLNLFFGGALLFFVISSFFMFSWTSSTQKKGLLFALAGAVLTLVLLFV